MNKEEKQPNVYMIPKNSFDTGYVFGGSFKTKNFIEGVVVAIPFLGIFIYGWTQLGWDVESTVAYAAIVCAGVFVAVSHGVGDDSFFEFLAHVIHFRKSCRISKYNPRIKTELEPDYLMKENGMLPKEKLKEAWENFKKKVLGGGDGPISADITADDLQIYYDDDEDFVEKPDELKTKAELKAEAKQRAKEEKEFINSLPRNQRRAARAALKQKHKEEAEAKKRQEEEHEKMVQERIKRRIEKAERIKAAQYRAKLVAMQQMQQQTDPNFIPAQSEEQTMNVVLDEVETITETPEMSLDDVTLLDGMASVEPEEIDVSFDEEAATPHGPFVPRIITNERMKNQAGPLVRPLKAKPQIYNSHNGDFSADSFSIFDDEE